MKKRLSLDTLEEGLIGINNQMECSKCKKQKDKLVASFGKKICLDCKNNRPNKGTGNSGMFDKNYQPMIFSQELHLISVPKSDGLFGHLFFSHYPKSKGIVGRCLCYLIANKGEIVGIVGASSPPKNYGFFNNYFNKDNEKYFVNNNVFRIIKSEKNLATRILKLFRTTVRNDYKIKYGDDLLGLVTFVEKPRTGNIYKADNWTLLGETQGKRMRRNPITWEKTFEDGEIKFIYGYKYKI